MIHHCVCMLFFFPLWVVYLIACNQCCCIWCFPDVIWIIMILYSSHLYCCIDFAPPGDLACQLDWILGWHKVLIPFKRDYKWGSLTLQDHLAVQTYNFYATMLGSRDNSEADHATRVGFIHNYLGWQRFFFFFIDVTSFCDVCCLRQDTANTL